MDNLFVILLPLKVDRDEAIKFLEEKKAISFWFYNLPYSFFAHSELQAAEIHALLYSEYKGNMFFVINLSANHDYVGSVPSDQAMYFKKKLSDIK